MKKKLLLIHNKYRDLGGEDIAVENEILLLEKYFNVETIYFENTIYGYVQQIISFILNKNLKSGQIVATRIKKFNPDIIYVHNTWFKASIQIFNVILKSNSKVVIKLHNFRYKCTNTYSLSKHLDEKSFCEACALKKENRKIFNKYFQPSYLKSLLVIRYGKKYFQILKKDNIKLFVLTNFHKSFLENLGFSNISVLPNHLNLKKLKNNQTISSENYLLYAGRVSEEKGVDELIEAFISSELDDFVLKIIGDGPHLPSLKLKYNNSRVEFIDFIENQEVLSLIQHAKAVVTATKLWEGQPTLLCEASLLGIPSIFPRNGGIAEFYPDDYQLSFKKNDYQDLKNKLNLLLNDENIEAIGKSNRKFIEAKLDENILIDQFNKIIYE